MLLQAAYFYFFFCCWRNKSPEKVEKRITKKCCEDRYEHKKTAKDMPNRTSRIFWEHNINSVFYTTLKEFEHWTPPNKICGNKNTQQMQLLIRVEKIRYHNFYEGFFFFLLSLKNCSCFLYPGREQKKLTRLYCAAKF